MAAAPAAQGAVPVNDDDEVDLAGLRAFLNISDVPAVPDDDDELSKPVATGPVLTPPGLTAEDTAQVSVKHQDDFSDLLAVKSWEELDLRKELLDGIYGMGFAIPSKIQEWAMPIALKGGNIIAQAQNGSGKTAAFALAMLHKVQAQDAWTQGMCICHTRELANQNHQVISKIGEFCGLTYHLLVAGENPRWVDSHIVIGTPGKLEDLIKRRALDARWISILVIDEADCMIDDDGQGKTVLQIHSMLPQDTLQILLFSATWPDHLKDFAQKMVKSASLIEVKKEDLTLKTIAQTFIEVENDNQKWDQLSTLYGAMNVGQSIIFVNTRNLGYELAKFMKGQGHSVTLICGTQAQGPEKVDHKHRDRIMAEFRSGVSKVLIATDVLARGIDVPAVTLVINFELPMGRSKQIDFESYMHRIGRTGRFGLKGMAVNIITSRDRPALDAIRSHYGSEMEQLQGDAEEMESRIKALR